MAKQKTFKELYKDLEKTRKALEEQRQKETELEQQFGPALNDEIIKIVRAQYHDDIELYALLQDLQAGKTELAFIPVNPKDVDSEKFLTGDDTNEISE